MKTPGSHRGDNARDRPRRPDRRELPGEQPGSGGEQWQSTGGYDYQRFGICE